MSADGSLNATKSDLISQAQDDFDYCKNAVSESMRHWENDYKFAFGDAYNLNQWPDDVLRARQGTNVDTKPCLTVNKTAQHNLQITNSMKQNKIGIKYRAAGGGASYDSARVYDAIARHIEYQSNAPAHYDQQAEFMVNAGKGALRVITKYADDQSTDQEIFIEGIQNPLMVLFDPDAREPDKSDQKRCFVFEDVNIEDFKKKRKYKKYLNVVNSQPLTGSGEWIGEDKVRIAEYWRVEEKSDTLYVRSDGATVYASQLGPLKAQLEQEVEQGQAQKRSVERRKVMRYVIVGGEEVESERKEWVGSTIPIIPVVGRECRLEGKIDYISHTRALIDPQRIYNYFSPLSLDTPLPTPDGWTTMAEVCEGDWLLGSDGKPCRVNGISPIYKDRQCFEIKFDDGETIVADAEHKWEVEYRGKGSGAPWTTRLSKTKDLLANKDYVWATKPLDLSPVDLPLHPYALGAWLGDGTSLGSDICCHEDDAIEVSRLLRDCGYNVGHPRYYSSAGKSALVTIHGIRQTLRDIGVWGNKHIPPEYLRASREQREELLKGLMDTDGTFNELNQCQFTSTNPRIAHGFGELLRSLGIKAKYCVVKGAERKFPHGRTHQCADAFMYYFTAEPEVEVFALKRKRDKHKTKRNVHLRRIKRHKIVSIEPVASVPVKCVSVDNESHLFLVGESMIPTHNSTAVEYGALQTKTPWLTPMATYEEFQRYYDTANVANHAVLPYNHVDENGEPIPPPQRIEPPVPAPVALAGMQTAANEMMMASGQYQAVLGEQGNERSGKAINERQQQGENATFHFNNGLAIAIRRIGVIIMEIVPRVYDTQRVLLALADDGSPMEILIDPRAQQAAQKQLAGDQQIVQWVFNPNVGKYYVMADTGPAYGTRKQETFNAISLILTQAPQLTQIIGDLLLRSADFQLADEAASRLRRMVPPEATGDGPSPSEQQLQQQVQQLTNLLQGAMQELGQANLRLRSRDQMRDIDAYNAITTRMKTLLTSLKDSGRELNPDDMAQAVMQTLREFDSGGASEVIEANEPAQKQLYDQQEFIGVG